MKNRLPGCLFCGFGALFAVIGFALAEQQRRRLAHWMEVPAQVVAHDLVESHDEDGTSYRPVLKLRYLADGMPEFGEGFSPVDVSSSRGWAEGQLAEFPVGKHVTAWADPANPAKAFVVREVSIFPYIFVLFPMIFVFIGARIALLGNTPNVPVSWIPGFLLWTAVGLAAAVHYSVQPGAWGAGGVAAFGVYFGVAFVPATVIVLRTRRAPIP